MVVGQVVDVLVIVFLQRGADINKALRRQLLFQLRQKCRLVGCRRTLRQISALDRDSIGHNAHIRAQFGELLLKSIHRCRVPLYRRCIGSLGYQVQLPFFAQIHTAVFLLPQGFFCAQVHPCPHISAGKLVIEIGRQTIRKATVCQCRKTEFRERCQFTVFTRGKFPCRSNEGIQPQHDTHTQKHGDKGNDDSFCCFLFHIPSLKCRI